MNIKRLLLLALLSAILIISMQIGCDELVTERITIVEAGHPIANFSVSDPADGFCCAPCVVTFQDESDGPRHMYIWDFGDGVVDTEYLPADLSTYEAPTHTYNDPGRYKPALTIKDTTDGGGEDTQLNGPIIYVGIPPAEFVVEPDSGCFGSEVSFHPTQPIEIISYTWDFGDGSPLSTEAHPIHIFPDTGTYTVKLVVNDAECGQDSTTAEVVVNLCPQISIQASDSSGCAPIDITFFDGSELWGQTVISRLWEFGDGGISIERDPVHQYTTAGNYTVTLTVETDAGSTTDSFPEFISVAEATVADFDVEGDTAFCKSDFQQFQVNFINLSQGAYDSSRWDFGDGVSVLAEDPVHVYLTPGVYTCSLFAYGPCGGDTIVKDSFIFLSDTLLDANIVLDLDTTYGEPPTYPITASFFDASTLGVRMDWEFFINEVSVSTGSPTFNTTLDFGTYGVKMVVSNECGSAEDSIEVVVSPP
ncbi:MAG: PKD domain-containing protein [Candidatus Zixiibacteriota bacterium]|nr:MAG: PKD domain-containing protein [candidate division Zixibacteria bacterium]